VHIRSSTEDTDDARLFHQAATIQPLRTTAWHSCVATTGPPKATTHNHIINCHTTHPTRQDRTFHNPRHQRSSLPQQSWVGQQPPRTHAGPTCGDVTHHTRSHAQSHIITLHALSRTRSSFVPTRCRKIRSSTEDVVEDLFLPRTHPVSQDPLFHRRYCRRSALPSWPLVSP